MLYSNKGILSKNTTNSADRGSENPVDFHHSSSASSIVVLVPFMFVVICTSYCIP